MQCIFEINSRPKLSQPAEQKHDILIKLLKEIKEPWGISVDMEIPFPGFKGEFTATSTLTKFVGKGIKISAFYRFRNRLENDHSNDDRIYIEFNAKNVDYKYLVTHVFPQLIKGFNAYTAGVLDRQLIFKDYEEKRFGNRRKIINRVYPVSFYDDEVCVSFFKKSPKKIAELLKGNIYKAEVFNNGIMIIADTIPYSMEKSIEFEFKMKSLIKY
jgi:hypothetical protein